MSFQDKINQYLKEIQELEKLFREAQSKEILPLSFFSSSTDILNRLKAGVYEIEAAQICVMQEHLKKSEESEEPREVPVLAENSSRKVNTAFEKSVSLNDRFMFQRDLFHGNTDEMNQAFAQLNTFQSLKEVVEFLDEKYTIPWNSDSGIALKEILDKRFA